MNKTATQKLEAARFPETPEQAYYFTWCELPEHRHLNLCALKITICCKNNDFLYNHLLRLLFRFHFTNLSVYIDSVEFLVFSESFPF
jgi:hypothetical protein